LGRLRPDQKSFSRRTWNPSFLSPITVFSSEPNQINNQWEYQYGGVKNMDAYCFKCRSKREIRNPQQVTLKNGRPATQGQCPQCGTKVFRIGKA
jgi:hypothetical protein